MAAPKIRFKKNDGSDYPAPSKRKLSELTEQYKVRNKSRRDLMIYSVNNKVGFLPQSEQFDSAGYLEDTDTSIYMIVPPNHFAYNPARINIGSIGYQNLGHDVQVSSLYEVFSTNDELNDNYLHHWFNAPYFNKMVHRLQEGGVRLYFYYDKLCELDIYLPCLEEQQKIADFLSDVDELINASEDEITNLEMQKKAAMKKIFSQEVRFKKPDGSEFPEWEEQPLKVLFPHIRNGFVGTVTDCFTDKEDGIRYLEGTNIHDGAISDNVEVYVTKEFDIKHMKSKLKADDIVMVQSGHVGDCAVIKGQYIGANCHALIILSNGGKCCSDFFVDYFHSPKGIKKISVISTGNTVKHILASAMQDFIVPVPCLKEQRLIADFLSTFDEAINAAKEELTKYRELKKGLLQQMFI